MSRFLKILTTACLILAMSTAAFAGGWRTDRRVTEQRGRNGGYSYRERYTEGPTIDVVDLVGLGIGILFAPRPQPYPQPVPANSGPCSEFAYRPDLYNRCYEGLQDRLREEQGRAEQAAYERGRNPW